MKKNGKRALAVGAALLMVQSAVSFPVMAGEVASDGQGSLGYEIKKGDTNNDGKITEEDVTTGLKFLTGEYQDTTLYHYSVDVDGNGTPSVRDVYEIMKKCKGQSEIKMGVENLPEVTYQIPEAYQEGSEFLAEKAVGFYGADGYGKYTTGGRGGRVIYVTNLEDSGPGSFREAVDAKGPRIIIFRVSGNIKLKSQIHIRNGNLTIAGETAPGDGINLVNYPLSIDNAENVIIRYLNMRSGDYQQAMGLYRGGEGGVDSLTISNAKNVIIDHCSAIWGTDETLSITADKDKGYAGTSDKISVQWSIIANSLVSTANYPSGYTRLGLASLIAGGHGSKYTFHHNIYASHASRMPEMCSYVDYKTDEGNFQFEFINNVVYNWGGGAASKSPDADRETSDKTGIGETVHILRYDYVNNYYKPGATSGTTMLEEGSFGNQLFVSGNWMNGEKPEDQLSLVNFTDDILPTGTNVYYNARGLYLDKETLMYKGHADFDYSYLKESRFADTLYEGLQEGDEAYSDVLASAGSSLSRDSIDLGLIEGIADGTGSLIDYPHETDGWSTGTPSTKIGKEYGKWLFEHYPNAASYEPYKDTDQDGMSDAWEDFMGLDKNKASDGAESYKGTEYTNLDVFLQFLVEHPAAAIEQN